MEIAKTTEPENSMQWFVFFKDQLLLKKEYTTNGENKYGIPHGINPPVTPEAGCTRGNSDGRT